MSLEKRIQTNVVRTGDVLTNFIRTKVVLTNAVHTKGVGIMLEPTLLQQKLFEKCC
jgi:hypothetical protein